MQFFDINLYAGTYSDFLSQLFEAKKPTLVFTPNPEILYRAYHDEAFMNILQQADHNVPDGNGLYVGSMMQEGRGFLSAGFATFFDKNSVHKSYGELIKGSDLTQDILQSGANHPRNVLIIDRRITTPTNTLEYKKVEVQKNLKHLLEKKYTGITVHVIFAGDMAADGIAHYIELHQIDFVFSCIGMKQQEQILVDIFAYLPNEQKVVGIGVGASIDFLLGVQKRAPKIWRDTGLEWLYRLIRQPRIRFGRIKTAFVDFPKLIKKTTKLQKNPGA